MAVKSVLFFALARILVAIAIVLVVADAHFVHRTRSSSGSHHGHPGRRSHRNLMDKRIRHKPQDHPNSHGKRSHEAELISSAREKRHIEDYADEWEEIVELNHTSLCQYQIHENVMKGRNPEVIVHVDCLYASKTPCTERNNIKYFCTQATGDINIIFRNGSTVRDTVRMGCLCAREGNGSITNKPTDRSKYEE